MGSGALVETNMRSCRALLSRSETGSGAERIFRTHQRGRGILWIPDRGVDKATDGRKRMLERLRLVVLLDLVEGRLQEHLRLDRAHGALPCDGAKEPCGRHGRVAVDGIGLTELIGMDHAGRGHSESTFQAAEEVQEQQRRGAKNTKLVSLIMCRGAS